MTEYASTVVIERDEDGRFLAICPGLQGCYTEGETEDEAQTLISDAIRLHVQDRIETGEPIYHEVGATKGRVAVSVLASLPSRPGNCSPSFIVTASSLFARAVAT